MILLEKIQHLENYLYQEEQNFADSFKCDIAFYFNEDFTEENQRLSFLKNLNSIQEIETFVENLTSQFVLKFYPEGETENDFIHEYLIQNYTR
jgi:hypothetical protein